MSDVVISVRGEAEAVVAPDVALLNCVVRTSAASKAAALGAAAGALREVEAALAGLGGVVRRQRRSARTAVRVAASATTYDETYYDRHTEEERRTGQVIASVRIDVRVRDLDLLARASDELAAHERLRIYQVSWDVDADNAAWPRVRADAIGSVAARSRLRRCARRHGDQRRADRRRRAAGGAESRYVMERAATHVGAAGGESSPQLDPVPQRLSAVIDARVIASVPSWRCSYCAARACASRSPRRPAKSRAQNASG